MSNPDLNRAKKVLKSLIEGNDPTTNEPLPRDSVLNQVDVLRALLTASVIIDDAMIREARRSALPDNVGKPWSQEEEQQLVAGFEAHDSITDIAARHGRTHRSIEARLERLGLMRAEDRATAGGFGSSYNTPKKKGTKDEQ